MIGPSRVLSARSGARTVWDSAIALLALISCFVVSYQFAFAHRVEFVGSLFLYLTDLVFLADVALNRRTSLLMHGREISDPKEICRHYRRHGLLPDLLGALPFDLLLLSAGWTVLGGIDAVLLLRLLRLLRARRAFAVLTGWERHSWSNPGQLRILKLAVIALLLIHGITCFWYLAPFAQGMPESAWPVRLGLQDATPGELYLQALYWAVVHITTIGIGVGAPGNDFERVFAMASMLIGASIYAVAIGSVASLVSNLDSTRGQFRNRAESTDQYLRARRVPPRLIDRVSGYHDYLWERFRGMSEDTMLAHLPDPLRLELLAHLRQDLAASVPLFREAGPVLSDALLRHARTFVYDPGSLIMRDGQLGDGLYFLSAGRAEVLGREDGRILGTLLPGDQFGDLSLLLSERRTASVRAADFCHVIVLPAESFAAIRKDYPELREILSRTSGERSQRMSELVLAGVVL